MIEDPVAAAQCACDLALAAMCEAIVPALEFIERHVTEFEGEAAELLEDYRRKFDEWVLAGAELATLKAEHGEA